jgi:hypothetical protein
VANSREGLPERWLPLLTPAFGLFLIALVLLANSGTVSQELLRITRAVPGRDKTVHFLLAGTMALLLNWSWRAVHWRIGPVRIQKGTLLIGVLCTLEEFSQIYMRARSFDLEDLVYDYLGILVLGQIGVWLYGRAQRSAGGSGAPPGVPPGATGAS